MPLLLYALLQSARIQTYVVGRLADYLASELETEIRVGRVDLSLSRGLLLQDVELWDQEGGKLLEVDRMRLRIGRLSVSQRHLVINHMYFQGAALHLKRGEDRPDYNFQFLLDYFAANGSRQHDAGRWSVQCLAFDLSEASFRHVDRQGESRAKGFNPADFFVKDLNLAIHDINLEEDKLSFHLDRLFYLESSGFLLNHLSGWFSLGPDHFQVLDFLFQSGKSALGLDLLAEFPSSYQEKAFPERLQFSLQVRDSQLDLAHLGYFLPAFHGMNDLLHLSGEARGEDGRVEAKSLVMAFGEHSQLAGSLGIDDLFSWPDSHVEIQLERFQSSLVELESFRLPEALEDIMPELPDYLHTLGEVSFTGELLGSPSRFTARGELISGIGELFADIQMQKDTGDELYAYAGSIRTKDLDVGMLAGRPDILGRLNMQAELVGSGLTLDKLNLHMDGDVKSLEVLDNTYEGIALNGDFLQRRFTGSFRVDDPNVFLDFTGMINLEDEVPAYDFTAHIDRANLTAMNLFQRDSIGDAMLSARMQMNARAASLDDMEGEVTIRNIVYSESILDHDGLYQEQQKLLLDSIFINNTRWSAQNQHLRLRSGLMDADIHGEIHFETLLSSLPQFVYSYMPALSGATAEAVGQESPVLHQDMRFSLRFNETDAFTSLFLPWIRLSPGSWIDGEYKSREMEMKLNGHADILSIAGRRFLDWSLHGDNGKGYYDLSFSAHKLMLSDSLVMQDLDAKSLWGDDKLEFTLMWEGDSDDPDQAVGGRIHLLANMPEPTFIDFSFLTTYAYINGDLWRLNVDNRLILDGGSLEISHLMAYHGDQYMVADGMLSKDPRDRMSLSFANFDVSYTDILLGDSNFDFGGMMDGYVNFSGLFQETPSIGAELHVEGFSFNHVHLGDFELQSLWDNEKEAFGVSGSITHFEDGLPEPLVVSGQVFTGEGGQGFDLDISLTGFDMSVWSRYLESFASQFHGHAAGNLHLGGPLSQPVLTGRAHLSDAHLFIPYLNVGYDMDHEVTFTDTSFRFQQMMLRDSLNNVAEVTGDVLHTSFKDFALDLQIRPHGSLLLNTSPAHNSIYYGSGFFTGLATLSGPADDITMNISARTNRGTRIFLPLGYSGEVRESHFISFVDHSGEGERPLFRIEDIPGALTLNFDLEVTPDAEIQLFFDTQFGDVIRARGEGDLRMEVTPDGAFYIYGDYAIQEGEYLFTLQNIINKRFRIQQGSHIRWTGDLNEANVDLRAAYRLRTSLYDLLVGEGIDAATAESFRRRVPVETILILEDRLFNPEITFEILVPGGDENTREMIERLIATDQEMNRQVFSLLILNRFMPTTFDQYNTALGYGVGSTSSELLSNQLSNWLSQISSEFDIGINYRPGDEISSQELELALSTQLFDDRVIIDGNFGVAGSQTATGHSTQQANQIIGDVNVEVMITPEGKFRVKAFNRSNTFDIINTNAPYTQGIGLFYRREFDRLGELFRRSRVPAGLPTFPETSLGPEAAMPQQQETEAEGSDSFEEN